MLTDAQFCHGLLDPHVKKQRVMVHGRGVYGAGRWLTRIVRTDRLPRPAQYFLPELTYQRIRQRR